jgi:leader peptidase (prepilin peptidase)/N-methyltransferase
MWIVPLEVCWFASLVGLAASTAAPHELVRGVSPVTGAMALAAAAGLAISTAMVKLGLLRPSFLDADDATRQSPSAGADPGAVRQITAVAIGREHGVNPRLEILWEVLFLAPALALAAGAYLLVGGGGWASEWWLGLSGQGGGAFAAHFRGLQASLWGYLVGGLWIWGMRILGTLAFGREAMGLGDLHILAAVGAVTGWIVPTMAFFVAPFFALLWALRLWLSRKQRELPYGPWLAAATLVMIVFYDVIATWLEPHGRTIASIWGRWITS